MVTIGKQVSSFKGRKMLILKCSFAVNFEASFDLKFGFPVSFLSFAAFRSSKTGG